MLVRLKEDPVDPRAIKYSSVIIKPSCSDITVQSLVCDPGRLWLPRFSKEGVRFELNSQIDSKNKTSVVLVRHSLIKKVL